ncbi:efflux RND transporter periplasmic adaptor subunit [Alteromonas flava]|uniref:efflux RND transporter periplasmic adaptor subunit n=1 Tax=Alteromonas flava TaxID=2048003 RepID=UPI000C292934|nr:efflux RND transporter periplasmic adaptor subunit [Alteromonas flava]
MSDTRSKFSLLGIVVVCFLSLFTLLFMSGQGKATGTETPRNIATVEVSALQWQDSYQKMHRIVGRVESAQAARTGFELSGLVAEVLVDDGDSVAQGQLLAQLDVVLLQSQLKQGAARLQRAQADSALAQSTLQRITDLVAKGLESQQRLDEARQRVDAAAAAVNEAQAGVESIQVNIDKSQLRAPFAGVVTARFVDQGTVVAAGQAVFELLADGATEVRLPMPADLVQQISIGETYTLRGENHAYPAMLRAVGQQRNQMTRSIDAVFQLQPAAETASKYLLPGDLLALDLNITVNEAGAWVPLAALSHGVRGLWNIYTVEQPGAAVVVPRAIEILYSDGEFAFIRGAIGEDMQIVVSGTHRLAPGQKVAAKSVINDAIAERR